MIFAHGSRFGGHALFMHEGKLHYVYNFLGIAPEQTFVSEPLEPGRARAGDGVHPRVAPASTASRTGRRGCTSTTTVVAEGPMRTQTAYFTLCGDGLCVGRDSSDAVSSLYRAPAPFTGGTIVQVEVNVGADQYLDLEKEAMAALSRE